MLAEDRPVPKQVGKYRDYLASPLYLAIFLYMDCGRKKGVIRVAEKSAIQRIKELDAERASIFEQARKRRLRRPR